MKKARNKWAAYLSISGQIYLQGLRIVLETQRRHGEENILAVDSLALFLLAFLGCCDSKSAQFNGYLYKVLRILSNQTCRRLGVDP
jgi:hypothetical protein